VLVHGFMRSNLSMTRMQWALEKEGYKVYNWGYDSRQKCITEHSADLLQLLQYVQREHPDAPLSFVTHSLGGLIVRHCLNHPDMQEQKGKLVMLAPPNQGSAYARKVGRFWPVRLVLGKHAGRELIQAEQFDSLGPIPAQIDTLIIAGSHDGKVSTHETCIKYPHKHLVVRSTHTFIMCKKSVIQEVLVFFKYSRFNLDSL